MTFSGERSRARCSDVLGRLSGCLPGLFARSLRRDYKHQAGRWLFFYVAL